MQRMPYKYLIKKMRNMCSNIETTNTFDDVVWIQNVTYNANNEMVSPNIESDYDTSLSLRKKKAYIQYIKDNDLRPGELPKIKIAWGNSIIYNECSICFEDIIDDRKVLPCKHEYHQKCIKEWFNYKRNCPFCRREV
jgi:hypothetical protein